MICSISGPFNNTKATNPTIPPTQYGRTTPYSRTTQSNYDNRNQHFNPLPTNGNNYPYNNNNNHTNYNNNNYNNNNNRYNSTFTSEIIDQF